MNNDWDVFDRFYDELKRDIYEQPNEEGRVEISRDIIASAPVHGLKSVLDVGCGEGYAQDLFIGMYYTGITASAKERDEALRLGRHVIEMDYNFIHLGRDFDLIFSSHSLEHSPFPLLTLMEWHRVGANLLLIVPNPKHYGYIGRNHYSVSEPQQIRWWLRRAGWKVIWKKVTNTDIAYFATREVRMGKEGWAFYLDEETYRLDRDDDV